MPLCLRMHGIEIEPAQYEHNAECEWLPLWWLSTSQNMWKWHYITQSRYFVCGTSRCIEGTHVDNTRQSQRFLSVGWFNATCFVLARSRHQENKKRKVYCVSHIILFHIFCVCVVGIPISQNIIKLYDQPKSTVYKLPYLTLRWLMSYIYIYGATILGVSRSHTTTQHSR